MPFPIALPYHIPELYNGAAQTVVLYGGLTTFVGPNGSGKTQVLRSLYEPLAPYTRGRAVRFVSGDRAACLEQIQAEFRTLRARPDIQIKIAARLKFIFKRAVYFHWGDNDIDLQFDILDAACAPYPAEREASGLLHLVATLAALYDDGVGALLLDEPEASLHPQLQAFLLREIQNVAGDPAVPPRKAVILATHSTAFIAVRHPKDLARIVFFTDAVTPPRQTSPDERMLQHADLQSLTMRLEEAHKEAFFCARPLLVEGRSDAIICQALDCALGLYLGVAGTQIVPVIGKSSMPGAAKLMSLIGKKPVILADLDGFADGLELVEIFAGSAEFAAAVRAMGYDNPMKFARAVYRDFDHIAARYWNDIARWAKEHRYWQHRGLYEDETAARRRAALATLLTASKRELRQWQHFKIWRHIRRRLLALFHALELSGCFILRRGTIEDYYRFARIFMGKTSTAIREAEALVEQDLDLVKYYYGDIIRALRYAIAAAPSIDEAPAVADLLIAAAAPALQELTAHTSAAQLNALARDALGDKARLFRFANVSAERAAPTLRVELNSTILDVRGFPLEFPKDCDLPSAARQKLGIAK